MKYIITIVILFHSIAYSSNKMEDFINVLENNISVLNANKRIVKETKKLINEFDQEKYITIFYFVDSEVTNVMLKHFSNSINKLKNIEPELLGKVMLRGLIDNNFKKTATYFKDITKKEDITNIEFYPIHFHSFKYFSLERVPAYSLSLCTKNFKFKSCEHLYLVKGDINLSSFLEIVTNENPKFKNLYYALGEEDENN